MNSKLLEKVLSLKDKPYLTVTLVIIILSAYLIAKYMDQTDGFYVTLIGDGGEFTKRLPEQLHGQYKVGLAEISLAYDKPLLNTSDQADSTILLEFDGLIYPIIVPDSYYQTLPDLFDGIHYAIQQKRGADNQSNYNQLLEKYPDARLTPISPAKTRKHPKPSLLPESVVNFTVNEARKRVIVERTDGKLTRMWLPPCMQKVLGLNNIVNFNKSSVLAGKEYSLDTGSLYIYTETIKPTMVNEHMTKLLRVIHCKTDRQTYTFNPIFYHQVEPGSFDTITIKIKDVGGRTMRLREPTVIVLRFIPV